MKDSCSFGKMVIELDDNKVIIHNLRKWLDKTMTFQSPDEAESYYKELTGSWCTK